MVTDAEQRRVRNVTFFECPLVGSCLGGNETDQCATGSNFNASSLLCGTCAPGSVRDKKGCKVRHRPPTCCSYCAL